VFARYRTGITRLSDDVSKNKQDARWNEKRFGVLESGMAATLSRCPKVRTNGEWTLPVAALSEQPADIRRVLWFQMIP